MIDKLKKKFFISFCHFTAVGVSNLLLHTYPIYNNFVNFFINKSTLALNVGPPLREYSVTLGECAVIQFSYLKFVA